MEYSFCRMRLPAIGATLPWQLVAAQDPGPMYFWGSFAPFCDSLCWDCESGSMFLAGCRAPAASPRRAAGKAASKSAAAHNTVAGHTLGAIVNMQNKRVCRLLSAGRPGDRVVFFAAWRERAKGPHLLAPLTLEHRSPPLCRSLRMTSRGSPRMPGTKSLPHQHTRSGIPVAIPQR